MEPIVVILISLFGLTPIPLHLSRAEHVILSNRKKEIILNLGNYMELPRTWD